MRLRFLFCGALALAACTFDFDKAGPSGGSGTGGAPPAGGNGTGGTGADGAAAGQSSDGGGPSGGGGATGGSGGEAQGGDGGMGGSPVTDACETEGGQCLSLPAGFRGPYSLSASGCGAGTVVDTGGRYTGSASATAPAATCNCACNVPSDPQCPGAHIQLDMTTEECTNPSIIDVAIPAGACQSVTYQSFEYAIDGTSPSADCSLVDSGPTRPPYSFAEPVVTCGDNLPACSGTADACVPTGEQYCVVSDTASACPGSGYPNLVTRLVTDADVMDNRDCSCTCGNLMGSCIPEFRVYTGANCTGQINESDTNNCITSIVQQNLKSVRFLSTVPNGTCGAPATASTGGVSTPSSAIVCCNVP